jgi:AcrR family transcriptional regulator
MEPASPEAAIGAAHPSERPLRRDAQRNRERILVAAGELFALRGIGVSLNDIAHHAGVGVGTVYRHFPDRDKLIETLFQARAEEMVSVLQAGLADGDPWQGLVTSLERVLEMQAADRALRDLVHDSAAGFERVMRLRERLLPMGEALVARARAAGTVRPDIAAADLPLIQIMVGAVIDAGREVDPGLWRRYLALLLRGISARPDSLGELPGAAPTESDIDRVLNAAVPREGRGQERARRAPGSSR